VTADAGPPPAIPVVVGTDLFVGGAHVPGRWRWVEGRGTHWVGIREDGSWSWGFDAEPQPMDGGLAQPPAVSPNGRYQASVRTQDGVRTLVGADTDEGGEGFGGVDLSGVAPDPPPRAVAVTDDGLVVAGGSDGQWLWRPLVDGRVIDLAETAPGQVVLGNTGGGLLVNRGAPGTTDGTQGEPFLARLAPDGVLTRVADVPTHDVLQATPQWLAYVPPGTVGGEAWTTAEVRVQHRDGSDARVLVPPEGWRFAATGFRWEDDDTLLVLLVRADGDEQALARCRPDPSGCVVLDLEGRQRP